MVCLNHCVLPTVFLSQSHFRRFSGNGDSEQTSYDAIREEEDISVELPPPDVQSFLLHLYFTYVHPFFPVIHKQDFLHSYSAMCVRLGCNLALLMQMAFVMKRPQCATGTPDADILEPPSHATTLQDVVALHVRHRCQVFGSA